LGSGTGGNYRANGDDGVLKWIAGILGVPGDRDYHIYDSPNARYCLAFNGTTGAATFAAGITCASQVIGTDPGGSELLRVGGGIACTTLSVASANYIYMRGNATTDGSVRMSSSADHVVLFESRQSGVWTTIGQFSGV
jgi:hypothetical protein